MVSEAVSVCSLPQEMLLKIFTLLSRSDLYNVLLVCRKWRTVAETPWLWRRMEVVVGQIKVTNMNLLNATRLRSVKRVRLFSLYHPDEEEAEAVFTAILEHEGIRELNISQNQISKVNPDTLAKAVNSMEQVNLHNAKLTGGQVEAVFQEMSGTTRLHMLSMGHVNISTVPANTAATALNRLHIVKLCETNITTEQLDQTLRLVLSHTVSDYTAKHKQQIPPDTALTETSQCVHSVDGRCCNLLINRDAY